MQPRAPSRTVAAAARHSSSVPFLRPYSPPLASLYLFPAFSLTGLSGTAASLWEPPIVPGVLMPEEAFRCWEGAEVQQNAGRSE